MAETRKVLGQNLPAANTLTALYTVPGATQAVVSTVTVCEQAGAPATYSIAVAIAGAFDTPAQYICFNGPLFANETKAVTIGITLGAGDIIRVKDSTGNVSFNAFGVELT